MEFSSQFFGRFSFVILPLFIRFVSIFSTNYCNQFLVSSIFHWNEINLLVSLRQMLVAAFNWEKWREKRFLAFHLNQRLMFYWDLHCQRSHKHQRHSSMPASKQPRHLQSKAEQNQRKNSCLLFEHAADEWCVVLCCAIVNVCYSKSFNQPLVGPQND